MAISSSSFHSAILWHHETVIKNQPAALRVFMLHSSHRRLPARVVPASLMRAFTTIKVFEDQSSGVVCYRDKDGELICEGYDEGPRLSRLGVQKVGHGHRDTDIIDLLKQAGDQLAGGASNKSSLFRPTGFGPFEFY